jgi:serine phosphatase RsbU (regulator of sigma subunit)
MGAVIEWGVAECCLEGEEKSGDSYVVRPFPNGVLVAVLDGAGHGKEASAAAKTAVDILAANPQDGVIALIKRCHEVLRKTRGVVMSLASFNEIEAVMTWSGVGNVEGILVRPSNHQPPESLLLRAGLIGHQISTLHAAMMPVAAGDTLVFATDGIRGGFKVAADPKTKPQQVAGRILAENCKGNDDALVLVARYIGADRKNP